MVLRRSRSLILKIIVGVPILWFTLIGMSVVFNGDSRHSLHEHEDIKRDVDHLPREDNDHVGKDFILKNSRKPSDFQPPQQVPVLEQPNPDWLRLQEKMKEDAARALRQKERERHMQQQEEQNGFNIPVIPQNDKVGGAADNVGGAVDDGGGNKYFRPAGKPEIPDDPNAPGENGKGMSVEKDKLSPEERAKYDQGFQRNAFNQYASDHMSVHRTLPDVRDPECRKVQYPARLPDTSVVVIFHNEAWSVLCRTVFSIIDRSPPHLLREVILVDDFSDFDHLKQPLTDFADSLPKVRLVRSKKREGLIRARLLGAAVAQGDVLTFLDSHCECTQGWLEPLLARIAENRSFVVTPVIDVIDDETIRYQYSNAKSISVGGFDWNLQFNWHGMPDHEKQRRKSDVDPVRSPTMAGGLFSIHREYFEYLGTYDPGMDIWGGENLELSFRTWMCGGTLEIVVCSHVGHIFRKRSPYSWKTGSNVVKKNSVRLAEVWMDEYKVYYYERFNYALIWMCGGTLETMPCSHVGHIFRKRNPNTIASKVNVVRKNSIRLAEVWMDEFKENYYERFGRNLMVDTCVKLTWLTDAITLFQQFSGVNVVKKNSVRLAEVWMDDHKKYYYERFNNDLGDYGDITSRKALRQKLQCKSFKWYLDTIYPELFIPGESVASGEIRNKENGMFNGQSQPACLDSPADKKAYNKAIKLWPCHNMGGNQYWMLSKTGEIRRDEGCLDYAGSFVMVYPCHGMKGNQEWVYGPDNTMRHKNTNLCIELSADGTKIDMKPCTGIDRQIWLWKRKKPDSESGNFGAANANAFR